MKNRTGVLSTVAVVLAILVLAFATVRAQQTTKSSATPESAAQTELPKSYVNGGVGAQGAGLLQIGQLNTLSVPVASATTTQAVAAPASGSTYLRALLIEKSTSATGSITVSYGTGTNCGTGNHAITTLSAATGQTLPSGYQELEILVPAANAVCLATDGSTTSARVLAQ